MDYRKINAQHPELEDLVPHSADWYRAWRKAHLEMFPDCDLATRKNLDMFVEQAEEREASRGHT